MHERRWELSEAVAWWGSRACGAPVLALMAGTEKLRAHGLYLCLYLDPDLYRGGAAACVIVCGMMAEVRWRDEGVSMGVESVSEIVTGDGDEEIHLYSSIVVRRLSISARTGR